MFLNIIAETTRKPIVGERFLLNKCALDVVFAGGRIRIRIEIFLSIRTRDETAVICIRSFLQSRVVFAWSRCLQDNFVLILYFLLISRLRQEH